MSPESVPPGEMGTHDHDDELERFFEGLRTAFPARPVAGEDEHVSGMIAQAHLQADKGDPVVRPASNADAPAAQVSWLPKQRRNRMTDRKLDKNWNPGLALKVLAPATVFFTLLGGVAWAGGLPAPLQRTAAHVASLAGVTIDDGTDATEVDTPDATSTDVPGATTFDQGDTTDPTSTDNQDGNAQGEDNSSDPTSTDNQDGDSQGEDNSGDTSSTDNQDGDSQGDSSGDSTSGDNNQGDSQDSTSGDGSSQDSQGDSSGSGDTSGDTSGDSGSGSDGSGSGGDGQN